MDSTALTPVPVPGTDRPLMAAEVDGHPEVALRHACNVIGVDYSKQLRKLNAKAWATVDLRATVAEDGKIREMAMIDRRTLTMWLATIDTNRVSETARPVLEAFQAQAADALDAYFHEGGAINPNATGEQLDTLDAEIRRARGQAEVLGALRGIVDSRFLDVKGRLIAARALGEAPELDPTTVPLYAQNYLRERGLPADLVRAKSSGFGKRVKGRYMEVHGEAPAKHFQEVDGRPREINAYTEADRPIFDHVWATYYEQAVA